MAQTLATDPLTTPFGLAPRYWREQQKLAFARASAAVAPIALDTTDLLAALRPVDAVTADLRRRIHAATPPRRTVLVAAAPAFAGVSLALGVLLGN